MLWAFDSGYAIATVVFALLAIAVKEDQALFVGVAAAAGAWRFRGAQPGRIALGIAIVAVNLDERLERLGVLGVPLL